MKNLFLEVFADDYLNMKIQAFKITKWGKMFMSKFQFKFKRSLHGKIDKRTK